MSGDHNRMNTRNKRIALVIALVLAIALAFLLAFGGLEWGGGVYRESVLARTRRALVDGVTVGMTRAEVIRRLGRPENVARSRGEFERTASYVPVPTRQVEKEVLEYYSFVWKLYVYIDRRDRVTALEVART